MCPLVRAVGHLFMLVTKDDPHRRNVPVAVEIGRQASIASGH
jgi:hypothetical protein